MEVLNELASSSLPSSSPSGDEEPLLLACPSERKQRCRVLNFINVINNYSETEFRDHFRVRREVADILIEKFQASEFYRKKQGGGGRKEIPAKIQIFVFLWFAGNKDSYREVANIFNVSISSASRILTNVLEFFFKFSPEYIEFPQSEEEKLQVSQRFEQIAGFENVLGCIDCCYIPIRKPANKTRSKYINRQDLLSLTLQGICDADKKFIDVFVGSPSKIPDAKIYRLSFISKDLPEHCGTQYHLLGDADYPIREYLLTPYKDFGNLTAKKKKFNRKLNQTRVKIENSFSLLESRFRKLTRLDFFTVDRMCKFILACCVIHNLCIEQDDIWMAEENIDTTNSTLMIDNLLNVGDEEADESDLESQQLGEMKRNTIADSF